MALGTATTLSDDDPEDVGTTAGEGIGAHASRDDHVHSLGTDCVAGSNIADGAVGSEHIDTLDAALDCGQQELQNVVLHKAADAPGTPAVGQVYYNTGDSSIYLRVAT